jgi:translation initiation factor 2B subunit (eIF-2B alpha/beta/delta family)
MSDIERLQHDNISGAAYLTGEALAVLARVAEEYRGDPAGLVDALACAGSELARAQPMMASIRNRADRVATAAALAIEQGADTDRVRQAALSEIDRLQREAERNLAEIARHGAALIDSGAAVLTYSSSSAVRAILLAARERVDRVLITESRPISEGTMLANELAASGLACEVWIDAAMAQLVQRADIAFVGADTVTPAYVHNKLGTHTLAILCRDAQTPIYACFASDKILDHELDADPQQMRPPSEIAGEVEPAPGVSVMNLYFGPTPRGLFTGLITEQGLLRP